jgi:glycosyltransferase involved in cell wall biosynthesis
MSSTKQLRVGLATSGRFHMLDLARELDLLGVDVTLYSYVSQKRTSKFGLPLKCHRSLLPVLFPLVAWERLLPRFLPRVIERLMCWALDIVVAIRMRPCDVFGCMSGMYVIAPRVAKKRYGAKVIVYRASTHIIAQQQLLARMPKAQQVSNFIVQREINGYELADKIGVPSAHVVDSFAAWPAQAKKLVKNPYGVDISQFPLRDNKGLPAVPTVLFVGHWSYRKGADILVKALETLGDVHMVHVGALLDLPFPNNVRFTHHDYCPQWKLTQYYAAADVFVLPSREDGFGYVLAQALASGLPVVCTDRTGGQDLAQLLTESQLIRIVPAQDVAALRAAIARALSDFRVGDAHARRISDVDRERLSWRCYASRELAMIAKLLPNAA